jgi:two-component system chemotaxis response regulator CheB
MAKIRGLIVDDSVAVRRLVSDVLESDPSMDVAAVAATGRIALAKIPQVQPDVVTRDVEMPDIGGLETLREIRRLYPKLPVIMFSTVTERGAAATIEALSAGANDYVPKPANIGSAEASREHVKAVLIPKIFAACREKSPGRSKPDDVSSRQRGTNLNQRDRVDILAIASSTGGPNALTQILATFPADFPVPIVIVQHMPPMFTRLLADQLGKKAKITISEVMGGELLRPGHALVAHGDFHFRIARDGGGSIVAQLNQDPPENSCRPAADVLFRSVAEIYENHVLGVVLTGMGRDGCLGSQAIRDAGGHIIVQDQASSVVWGMAGSVVQANLAEAVLPLSELGEEIGRRVRVTRPMWCSRLLSTG